MMGMGSTMGMDTLNTKSAAGGDFVETSSIHNLTRPVTPVLTREVKVTPQKRLRKYRVGHLLADLGWVDLDFGSSPGWWAATVATYCPGRMMEHSKSKSTQPRSASRCPTL